MPRESISMSDLELRDFLDRQSWMLLVTLDASGAAAGIVLLLWARIRIPGFDQRMELTGSTPSARGDDTHGGTAE